METDKQSDISRLSHTNAKVKKFSTQTPNSKLESETMDDDMTASKKNLRFASTIKKKKKLKSRRITIVEPNIK